MGLILFGWACQGAAPAGTTTEPTSAAAQSGFPSATPSSAQRGQELFDNNCGWCHGSKGERGAVPLRDAAPNLDDTTMAAHIADGIPDRGMPPHDALTPDQIADLLAFIRSWQQ